MVAVLTVAGLTVSGSITPLMLLILTFALSAGDAFKAPTWRALQLVPKEDLPAAASTALNSTSPEPSGPAWPE